MSAKKNEKNFAHFLKTTKKNKLPAQKSSDEGIRKSMVCNLKMTPDPTPTIDRFLEKYNRQSKTGSPDDYPFPWTDEPIPDKKSWDPDRTIRIFRSH